MEIEEIDVTAQARDCSAPIDPRFHRAKCFVIVDTDAGESNATDSTQNLNAPQGAGIRAGRNVVELGVKTIIAEQEPRRCIQGALQEPFEGDTDAMSQSVDAAQRILYMADNADESVFRPVADRAVAGYLHHRTRWSMTRAE
ncbi:MAG: hypothetical protein GVY16_04440 [Planctomycetes bacterium]|jgi:uncharacterized protein with ATP-grasp and redox domains|nr:NifB/NifX family molybdenum-iron cluster-binding protein [Phycisphaerae bacterium]NBB94970.1 hypothetical protein [Planctomycetota bacterium]